TPPLRFGRGRATFGKGVEGDIELLRRLIPERIRLGSWPVVDLRLGVDPVLAGRVQPENAVGLGIVGAQHTPPRSIVEPEFAFRLFAGRTCTAGAAGYAVDCTIAFVDRLGCRDGIRQDEEQAE